MIRTVLIEDEPNNRVILRSLINSTNIEFVIVGELTNVREAISMLPVLKPDCVFLDIKLPDGDGFEILELTKHLNCLVVFVTGFDNYALKAFDYYAVDYLLKPINQINLSRSLNRLSISLSNLHKEEFAYSNESIEKALFYGEKVKLHHNNSVVLVSTSDIVSILSENGSLKFTTRLGLTYFSGKSISDIEFLIDSNPNLIKINRGSIININYILSYNKGKECYLHLLHGMEVVVSRRKKNEILLQLEKHIGVKSK